MFAVRGYEDPDVRILLQQAATVHIEGVLTLFIQDYGLPLDSLRLRELSTIGPRGAGRFIVDGSIVPNPVPGVPGVPLFTPLNFPNGPTNFRGSHVLQILPEVKSSLESQLGDPNNTNFGVRNIEVFKQGTGLIARDFATPYSVHVNAGVQRELATHMVISA